MKISLFAVFNLVKEERWKADPGIDGRGIRTWATRPHIAVQVYKCTSGQVHSCTSVHGLLQSITADFYKTLFGNNLVKEVRDPF